MSPAVTRVGNRVNIFLLVYYDIFSSSLHLRSYLALLVLPCYPDIYSVTQTISADITVFFIFGMAGIDL